MSVKPVKTHLFTAKWRFAIWCLLFSSVVVYGVNLWQSGAKVQSDILAMLPHLQQDELTHNALQQVENRLANQVYIAIVSSQKQTAINAAKTLIHQLKHDPQQAFSQVTSASDSDINALGKWYFDHRFKLLTADQQHALTTRQLDGLIAKAQQQLYSAFGFANSQLISQDPLLLFSDNMLALTASSSLSQEQGILFNQQANQTAAIVIAKGAQSAFNPNAQQQQLAALNHAFAAVAGADVQILKAGALFHAQAATASAKQEITFIGGLSLIGVVILVWLGFRTLMPLHLALLTLSSGLVFALVTTLSLFNELHLLTLVFGTSLIGIAIDYSFHFYCEKLSQPQQNAQQVIDNILPAMTLALATSSLAFIGIGFTPFPGMQQVAVFCASGLFGAYITLVLAFPLLANKPLKPSNALNWAQYYLHLVIKISAKPVINRVVFCIIGLVCFAGLLQLQHNDDIRYLQQSPQQITDEENQLRHWLSGGTDNQFILVSAENETSLLEALHQLTPTLDLAVNQGELNHFFSIATLLPSFSQQQQNYQLQGLIYQQNLPHIIDQLGLNDDTGLLNQSLLTAYLEAQPANLTPNALLAFGDSALKDLWLTPTNKGSVGAIVLLTGINKLDELTTRINHTQLSDAKVKLVDKVGDISNLMGQYRQFTMLLLLGVLVIACIIFCIKYPIKLALAVIGVPTLAIILTLSSLGLLGSPFSLFHALALILVLGIGIDYSLFFAEAKHTSQGVMMAIFMSACSTLLAFGLLAFSQTNAIHFFGLTLLLGIGYAFLLAPFMTLITRKMR
ncbi:MMPL family transporter [Shewanella holmiensis]|uniref:MMPL family transporter n=1 Tax=Shewanella holmiensis TaxID=2952222 RepID=A0A9X2WL26_9GAMM|nr:MMPL family transporter [Shewanella holmiensis]MCT7941278.1 MMPL family transporter [Shewanella holmiensis]